MAQSKRFLEKIQNVRVHVPGPAHVSKMNSASLSVNGMCRPLDLVPVTLQLQTGYSTFGLT